VLSLIGDVAEDRDGPGLNAHVVLALSDAATS
jgi:predicted DNA-binding protein with PD1-like motif